MNRIQLKAHIKAELDKVVFSIEYRQKCDQENPEKVDEQRRAMLHFLDGQREALEKLLKAVA